MKLFVRVLIALACVSVPVHAQESGEVVKQLVGRWEGEFQKEPHDRFNNHRVLLIGGVEQKGDAWTLKNVRFAGEPVNAALDMRDGKPTVQFQSAVGNAVKLTLEGEELVGMISLRGVAGRSQEVRPMRLKKIKV